MEQETNEILKCIDEISEKGLKSGFSEDFQKSVYEQAKIVGEYLGISSQRQSIWWSILFNMTLRRTSIDLDDISSYLDTTILKVLQYQKDIDELVKTKALRREKSDRRGRRSSERLNSLEVFVPSHIVVSLCSGNQKLPPRTKGELTMYEILDFASDLIQERAHEILDFRELCEEIESLLFENIESAFVKQIKRYKLPVHEKIILLHTLAQFTESTTTVDLVSLLKAILSDTNSQLKVRKEFLSGKSKLLQLNIVELGSENFKSEKYIQLTSTGKSLFGDDQNLFIDTEANLPKGMILSTSISEQILFFNEKEQKSIDFLIDLLRPGNYTSVLNRIKETGMKQGFTVLFHGFPGTGKTESVYQISRLTGRDIKRVEIDSTKSKWFGESERLIKKVFDSYKRMVETSELTPILLFNEADGIFSKRKENIGSNTSQTENAMQNIILQEMEDFTGILMATSNLTTNLDAAFERRFLYKSYFDKPGYETRFKIWKDKLPILTDSEIMDLSTSFEMSGGQIQNVSKKVTLTQILTGNYPNFQEIQDLCEGEFLDRKSSRKSIGFRIGSSL